MPLNTGKRRLEGIAELRAINPLKPFPAIPWEANKRIVETIVGTFVDVDSGYTHIIDIASLF